VSVLDVRSLRVDLGAHTVLHDVSFSVDAGEVVAILGSNGSGKSTLVRAVTGVIPFQDGSVEVFGEPLGPRAPLHLVGYVPQRVSAASGIVATASEVVTSGLLGRRRFRPGRGAAAKAAEALEAVGLASAADRPVTELSGGQQQRVLIARALVREPELLVLDEPVAGVDLPSQEAFARTLGRLVEAGTTVMVVLHELGDLAPLVRRAVVLRGGHVVHDGAPPTPRRHHGEPGHEHVHPHELGGEDFELNAPSLELEP
jgi:zinc transport system ATP-binding protein